jgi:hypothetical protein
MNDSKSEAGRAFIHRNARRATDRGRLRVLNDYIEDARAASFANTNHASSPGREERSGWRSADYCAATAAG